VRYLLLIPILYVTAVMETSLADVIRVGCVAPDLLALLAVIWLLFAPGRWTFLAAGAIGLASDLIAPGRLGLGMACFLLIGYTLTRWRAKFPADHLLWQVPTVWLALTLLAASLATGRWLLGETSIPLGTLLGRALGVGVYTAGVSLPLLMVIGWIREPFRARKERFAEL
jgi:cell shape-determining protein MreD